LSTVERPKSRDDTVARSQGPGGIWCLFYKSRDQQNPDDVPQGSLPQNSREPTLREEVHQLRRLLAEKTMEMGSYQEVPGRNGSSTFGLARQSSD
jgi:hypothetical protein